VILRRTFIIIIVFLLSGCAHHQKLPPEEFHHVYVAGDLEGGLVSRYAPLFLTYDFQSEYNRIGQPSAKYDDKGREHVYVDVDSPAVYYVRREFSTDKGTYTNLFYRVHFPKVPFSLIPFNLTAGDNVGILVVLTLDAQEKPVLVTTVGTCGCYAVIVPTTYLPSDALPEGWKEEPLKRYGERLPWVIDYSKAEDPKLLVHLRPEVHRIMDLDIIEGGDIRNSPSFRTIQTPLVPIARLETIPLKGTRTSLYYQEGAKIGHVKGSVKPWETIFLSLISLDFYVGTDKSYANSDVYGNPFYTSLKPWNREKSNMWNFPRFLKFWGWGL
jgi:hypothetical protein